jgi:putative aminopeptidase FrvX
VCEIKLNFRKSMKKRWVRILSKEIEVLEKLSNAFGLSGNEEDVAEILRKELEEYVDETRVDKLGKLSR